MSEPNDEKRQICDASGKDRHRHPGNSEKP